MGHGLAHKEGMELDQQMDEPHELVEQPYEYNNEANDEEQPSHSRPNQQRFDLDQEGDSDHEMAQEEPEEEVEDIPQQLD